MFNRFRYPSDNYYNYSGLSYEHSYITNNTVDPTVKNFSAIDMEQSVQKMTIVGTQRKLKDQLIDSVPWIFFDGEMPPC